jgi:hypothetical protein
MARRDYDINLGSRVLHSSIRSHTSLSIRMSTNDQQANNQYSDRRALHASRKKIIFNGPIYGYVEHVTGDGPVVAYSQVTNFEHTKPSSNGPIHTTYSQQTNNLYNDWSLRRASHTKMIFNHPIHGYVDHVAGDGPVIAYSQSTHFRHGHNKPGLFSKTTVIAEQTASSAPGKHYHHKKSIGTTYNTTISGTVRSPSPISNQNTPDEDQPSEEVLPG